jgi:type II secretory pathway predicted ATPase ExeA
MAQVQAMLTSSMAAGYNNLIVIEEAHRLPQATLRHLKGFLELEDGMRRMLGVCLIGQPELDDLLGAQNREIREIVQRCNRVALTDLDDDLEPYLHHKFERAGAKSATVLAANVYQAIATKLRYTPRGGSRMNDTRSVCYPLMVNNLVCKAMNFAAGEGFPQVTADVIAGC